MAGYIGARQGVTQVDGYNRSEADAEFVQVTGDTMTGALIGTDLTLSGGVYLGGTGSANLLDDYEEGTFTPSYTSAGISAVTYGTGRNGYYTKVGRLVTVTINIMTNAVTVTNGSSPVTITGLPFTSSSVGENRNAANLALSTRFTSNPPVSGQVAINVTEVALISAAYTTASDETNLLAGDLTTTTGNKNTIRLTATYFTD